MKTNKTSPVKENAEPIITRKTVTVGSENKPEAPKEKVKSSLGSAILILSIIAFASLVYVKTDWELVKGVPTVQDKPNFFKSIQSKQYFKSVVVPTPVPPVEIAVDEKKESVAIIKLETKSAKKQKISYANVPGYHAYDELIINAAKKYNIKRPVIIKAIIEQESHYNPHRIRYESKWEREYGPSIPKKRHENVEEWKMNFHSFGLMQIGFALHKDFCNLNSYADLYNPAVNIDCGTKLYGSCISAGNSETFCIRKYNGAGPATEIYKNEVLGRIARIMSVPTKLMS